MPEQALLFDLHPEGTEPPIPQRKITPACLLPWPPNQDVDVARAAAILRLTQNEVIRLAKAGHISGYQLRKRRGSREPWRISYQSIVDLCDRLRVKYAIRDRRPKLGVGRRWRDADLLPFPISDTVGIKEVRTGLCLGHNKAFRLIEEGPFDAYRFTPNHTWRISKTSLYAYRDSKKAEIELRRAHVNTAVSRNL